jgi:hypothetical protein
LLTLAWIADSHPDLYYSALLSSEEMDSEHLQTAVAEAATRGVNVQTPDINLSEAKTVVTPEGLRLGLRCIRGIGPVISGEIVEKRQRGNYRSIEDLCRRTNRRLVNRSVLEQLSAIGALDSIHPDRDEHPFYIDRIFEGAPLKSETGSTQILLFEVKEGKPAKREPARPKTPFILRPLAGFEGFLGEFKHEKVLALGRGRVRGTVCAGWFVEIFAPNPPLIPPYQGGQGEGPTTAFLTDGETTTPVVLAKNVPSPLLRTACLVRGIAGGLDKRFSFMRLLRRRRAPGRPDPPPWLRDLPVFYVSDWQPLSDVLAEADLGARVSVSLSATGKETLRALEECFRALATRSARYRSFSVVAADAAPLPRRAGNLKKIRPLPVSLTVRWLQEIPGISRVEVEKPAANESQTTDG